MWLGYELKRTAGTYWAGQPRPDCSYKLSCSNYLDDSGKTIPSPKSPSYFLCKKSLVQAKSVLVKKHTCQEGKRAGSWSVTQVIQETVFFTSQLCFSPSLTVWSNSDVRFSGLVLFHAISITQNSLNFQQFLIVLRNVTISKIHSICYGGCTEKLKESSTFNKYWSACCVWDRTCSCGGLGSH